MLEARRRLFREQVDRLVAFGFDHVRRHGRDVRAIDRRRDNLLQTIAACGETLGDRSRAVRIAVGWRSI